MTFIPLCCLSIEQVLTRLRNSVMAKLKQYRHQKLQCEVKVLSAIERRGVVSLEELRNQVGLVPVTLYGLLAELKKRKLIECYDNRQTQYSNQAQRCYRLSFEGQNFLIHYRHNRLV